MDPLGRQKMLAQLSIAGQAIANGEGTPRNRLGEAAEAMRSEGAPFNGEILTIWSTIEDILGAEGVGGEDFRGARVRRSVATIIEHLQVTLDESRRRRGELKKPINDLAVAVEAAAAAAASITESMGIGDAETKADARKHPSAYDQAIDPLSLKAAFDQQASEAGASIDRLMRLSAELDVREKAICVSLDACRAALRRFDAAAADEVRSSAPEPWADAPAS